jgi:hypothetical protein
MDMMTPFGAFSNSPFPHSRVKKISLKKKSKLLENLAIVAPPSGTFSNYPFPHTRTSKFGQERNLQRRLGFRFHLS